MGKAPKTTKPKERKVKSKTPKELRRIDWEEAFRWYCTKKPDNTLPSLRDVAEEFGVNQKTVEKHAIAKGWVNDRQTAGEKASAEFQEKMKDIAVHYQFKQWEDLTVLEDLTSETIGLLKGSMHDYKHAKTIEEKVLALKLIRGITVDILNLSNSLRITQNQKRVLLGMATEISKADITNTNKNVALSPEQVKEIDTFIEQNAHVTTKNTNTN